MATLQDEINSVQREIKEVQDGIKDVESKLETTKDKVDVQYLRQEKDRLQQKENLLREKELFLRREAAAGDSSLITSATRFSSCQIFHALDTLYLGNSRMNSCGDLTHFYTVHIYLGGRLYISIWAAYFLRHAGS